MCTGNPETCTEGKDACPLKMEKQAFLLYADNLARKYESDQYTLIPHCFWEIIIRLISHEHYDQLQDIRRG